MWLTDEGVFQVLRQRVRSGDTSILTDWDALRARAEHYCGQPAPAVTDKVFTPYSPSRDPHDYVSIATYFWPNPDTPDGLPYVSRDGRLSPDFHKYDRPLWDLAADAIVTAVRGARGGFTLSRPPAEITVLDVVEALEGPLAPTSCDGGQQCGRGGVCAAATVWGAATEALRDVFTSTTLEDLASVQAGYDTASSARR